MKIYISRTIEYVDHNNLFETNQLFGSKEKLVEWARETARKINTYLLYLFIFSISKKKKKKVVDHWLYVTISCERRETRKHKAKLNDEKEVLVKRRDCYGTKKCNYPFKLKSEQIGKWRTSEIICTRWRHNYEISVYPHSHAPVIRLMEE